MLGEEADAPFAAEGDELAALEILEQLRAGAEHQALGVAGTFRDEPQMLVGQRAHAQLHAVLAFHAVLKHVELQRTDHADHDVLEAGVRHFEDLDGALLRDLLDALDELLALHRVLGTDGHEVLRLEGRDAAEAELLARHGDGVADGEDAGIEHTDDVAGVGLLHDLTLARHHGLRLRKAHLLVALHMVILCVALEFARADAHERQTIAVRLVHVRLDLEHEGGEVGGEGVDHARVALAREGRGGHAQKALQERLHAEVRQRAAEEHGRERAVSHGVEVELAPRAEQLDLVGEVVAPFLPNEIDQRGIVQRDLGHAGLLRVARVGEVDDALLLAVVNALKFLAAADGPVDGVGVDAKLTLDLLAQLERVARLTVHLVDEGEDGDMAQGAHAEQLARLRLDALRAVDDHDRAVRRHERAVGILGEVLMARSVENVDAVAAMLELHDGGGHGDAALLFDLHPVGGRRAGALALDLAGLRDGPAVEQELFGQRGLTGVGVRNDGKGPAA